MKINKEVLELLIKEYSPYAIFLGGSRGVSFNYENSDYDIIVIVEKFILKKLDFPKRHHIIIRTIEQEILSSTHGMMFASECLYASSPKILEWFSQNEQKINTIRLFYNKGVRDKWVGSKHSYYVFVYFNRYYNMNYSNDSRFNAINYSNDFVDLCETIKNTIIEPTTEEKQQLILSFKEVLQNGS